jgi:hypothetical protein
MNPPHKPFSVQTVHGLHTFYPIEKNPDWAKPVRAKVSHYGPSWGAQLFIGLHVQGQPRWSAEQVRNKVLEIRERQFSRSMSLSEAAEGYPSFETSHGGSVIPMLGFWQSGVSIGDPREPSVSVMIESLSGEETRKVKNKVEGEFPDHMIALAKELALELQQDSIIIRIFYANVVQDIIEVSTENY